MGNLSVDFVVISCYSNYNDIQAVEIIRHEERATIMILITNFGVNNTKYYTYTNKPERNLAILEIIKDFMKTNKHHYAMNSREWTYFLHGKSISKREQALANLNDETLAILPLVLQDEAKDLRREMAELKEEWDAIQRTISLAKELITLSKEEAAYFRQSGTSELAILRVAESFSKMIAVGLFTANVRGVLFTDVKESAY